MKPAIVILLLLLFTGCTTTYPAFITNGSAKPIDIIIKNHKYKIEAKGYLDFITIPNQVEDSLQVKKIDDYTVAFTMPGQTTLCLSDIVGERWNRDVNNYDIIVKQDTKTDTITRQFKTMGKGINHFYTYDYN